MADSTEVPETLEPESPVAEKDSGGTSDARTEAQRRALGEEELADLLKSKHEEIKTEALDLLQKLIQTDTQNFADDGTEMDAVLILKELFEEAGIAYQIVEPKPGRGNIVARIAGDGSSGKGLQSTSLHPLPMGRPGKHFTLPTWRQGLEASQQSLVEFF